MKKIFSVLIAIVMVLANTSTYAVAETTDIVLSCAVVTAEPGETVEVALTLDKNSGFSGLNVYFSYSSELTFVSLTNAVSALTCTEDITTVWDSSADYTGTGTLAILKFTVPSDAKIGDAYTVRVHFIEAYDLDLNDVTATVNAGSIKVVCSHGDTKVEAAKDATCAEAGYTEGVYCDKCQTYISGHETIAATGEHADADGVWESDETNHYHTCACGEVIDTTAHTGGTATCTKNATCSACGTSYGTVDASNHGETEVRDAVAADCVTDGYTGDTYCKDCGEKISTGTVIAATGEHVDADGAWESDDATHYHVCGCGEIFDVTVHSGGTATCTKNATCSACGTSYGTVDASNHGETEVRDAVAADCVTDGYTGDTYCKDCGEKLSAGTVIAATGEHTYENGSCTVCGAEDPDYNPTGAPAGDYSNVLVWMMIMALSGVAVTILTTKNCRKVK